MSHVVLIGDDVRARAQAAAWEAVQGLLPDPLVGRTRQLIYESVMVAVDAVLAVVAPPMTEDEPSPPRG